MKISVVTVCYNSRETIEACVSSVARQDYQDVEHIIVDGGSTDGTQKIIEKFNSPRISKFFSEPDEGIYDAMNKGFSATSGDVVAFLNSDDYYYSSTVLSEVAGAFSVGVNYVYGNVRIVDHSNKLLRNWVTGKQCESTVRNRQIPHPALFIRRSDLARLDPPFDAKLRISADLKQQLLLIEREKLRGHYLNQVITEMKDGGASTKFISGRLRGWKESIDAYNSIFGRGGELFLLRKIFSKFV